MSSLLAKSGPGICDCHVCQALRNIGIPITGMGASTRSEQEQRAWQFVADSTGFRDGGASQALINDFVVDNYAEILKRML